VDTIMRRLARLALTLLVLCAPCAQAQPAPAFVVKMDEPVLTAPAPGAHGRLPAGPLLHFTVNASIEVPAGSLCLGHLQVEFLSSSVPEGLRVDIEPARLVLDLPDAAPGSGSSHRAATTRLVATVQDSAAAFEPLTFTLTARASSAGDLPCAVREGADARYLTITPDFRPEFSLEALPSAGDGAPVRIRIVNHANADARFELRFGRSNTNWSDVERSFRLEPASRSADRDRTIVEVDPADVPPGFDGRLRFTQRMADDAAGDTATLDQDLALDRGVISRPLHAQEEVPGLSAAWALVLVAGTLLRTRRRP
jgi:hypothetical protein